MAGDATRFGPETRLVVLPTSRRHGARRCRSLIYMVFRIALLLLSGQVWRLVSWRLVFSHRKGLCEFVSVTARDWASSATSAVTTPTTSRTLEATWSTWRCLFCHYEGRFDFGDVLHGPAGLDAGSSCWFPSLLVRRKGLDEFDLMPRGIPGLGGRLLQEQV